MLLSIPGLVFTFSCILVRDGLHVKAANIMLGKPTRLSSTYLHYQSGYANDGNRTGNPAASQPQLHPYWQGDLQGFYTVHNITVTNYHRRTPDVYIGVSSVDVDCLEDDVTRCGQWPADAGGGITLTFNCSHEQPVRFVRVWRNITDLLAIREVEVEGTPRSKNAAKYDTSLNKKLSTPVTTVNAISATDCGIKCHKTQPCLGFSYNPSGDPPCLLSPSTSTTTATGWVSYAISTFSHNITCDLTDQFN